MYVRICLPVLARPCVYEGQAGEDAGNPGGDHADRDEHKDQSPPPPASSCQAGKVLLIIMHTVALICQATLET